MVSILVQHDVKNVKEWKKAFDSHQKLRTDSGEVSAQVFNALDNPQTVIVLCKWSSKEKAEKFAASEELKKAMQESGVVGKPHIQFLNDI